MVSPAKLLLIILFVFNLGLNTSLQAQVEFKKGHETEKGLHKITFSLAQVYFQNSKNDELKTSFLPVYTLNYDYMITSKWSLGSHNDIPLQDIEKEETLEFTKFTTSERPVASKLIGGYHPNKHLCMMFGVGDEIAHRESFFISSVGADYSFHLNHSWEFGAELSYDLKVNTADTWMMGLGLTKIITKRHKG